jgi:alginate O-acetyltransferase complex protein AlgI
MWQAIIYVTVFLIELAIFASVRSRTLRQSSLLLASYALYVTWEPWFLAVLLCSTALNYGIGQWLRRKSTGAILWLGIVCNLALLGFFKYFPSVTVDLPFSSLQRFAHLALPVGISFWTFQAMSYLFDVYRGEEIYPSPLEFALYMAFFPVTISGPVCRVPDMLPQFRSEELVRWPLWEKGFRRIAIGVLMMQIASLLGHGILGGDGINGGFDRLTRWSGPDVWCLAFGYGLQLFFDFAGYSHIAIGAAAALGFTVPENFARPFASSNPSVFWTRWHMSLSFWIRDYVFLPMAILRREYWWRNVVLVISMVVFGVWHKATLLFVLWGGYQGMLLVLHRKIQQAERQFSWNTERAIWRAISWSSTIVFVSLGWILFRASSLAQAGSMFSALAVPNRYSQHALDGSLYLLVGMVALSYVVVLRMADLFDEHLEEKHEVSSGILAVLARRRLYWVPALYTVVLVMVLLITQTQGTTAAQFMYRSF